MEIRDSQCLSRHARDVTDNSIVAVKIEVCLSSVKCGMLTMAHLPISLIICYAGYPFRDKNNNKTLDHGD